MRIVCHAQALQGVGHWVRMQTIARGLAERHEVHLVDGGRPVPRPAAAREPRPIRLPALARGEGGLRAVAPDAPAGAVLAARAAGLADAVGRIRPDAVLIDHWPFGKWELEPEIDGMIAAARRAAPGARIVCSLRDLVPQTRHEAVPPDAWAGRVCALLRTRCDAVVVHADPAFVRLDEYFPALATVALPVRYTGFVVPPAAPPPPAARPYAVLSCGGGARSGAFLRAAIEAFRSLHARGVLGRTELRVFPGAWGPPDEPAALRAAAAGAPVHVEGFSPEFPRWLAGAVLSIGRAGYNTAAQLLRARVRAVVVPDAGMSDQGPRARRLAARGLATVVEGDPPRADDLAAAIRAALAGPAPRHALDLDGVAATRALLEGPWRSTATSASRSTRP